MIAGSRIDLQSLAAAEIADVLHLRDFRSTAIFEVFNTIRQKRSFDRLYRMHEGTDKRSRTFMGKWHGLFRRNPDHRISKSPKPLLSDKSPPAPNGTPMVIARG
jgi:hypothetical protein